VVSYLPAAELDAWSLLILCQSFFTSINPKIVGMLIFNNLIFVFNFNVDDIPTAVEPKNTV